MITLENRGDAVLVNGSTLVSRGAISATVNGDKLAISFSEIPSLNYSDKFDQYRVNGISFASISLLIDSLGENVFKNGGGNGSGVTTDASLLTSGTLPDARLSPNVATKDIVVESSYSSSPLWISNYDSHAAIQGAIPPWKDKHVQIDSRIQLIEQSSLPLDADVYSANRYRPAGRGMRVQIEVGDVAAAANRSEVLARFPGSFSGTSYEKWDDPIGSIRWYGFSVYIPTDFATDATGVNWLTILQLKGYQGGSPPISIAIKRSNFRLDGTRGANSGNIPNDGTIGAVTKGAWHRIVFGVKLSTTNNGWVEAWFNGVNTLPRVNGIITSDIVSSKIDPIYLKQGIYRANTWEVPHTLFFGPTKIGDTRASVMNPKIYSPSEDMLYVPTYLKALSVTTAPTSPSDGDMWFIGDVMYRRIGGVTKSITFS